MITERALTPEDLDEIAEAAAALDVADLDALDDLVDAWGEAGADDAQMFHLGAWWGERVRTITGWAWVNLRFGDGLETPALVSADRSVACLPLQLAAGVLEGAHAPVLRALIERLEAGQRPKGAPGSYALIH